MNGNSSSTHRVNRSLPQGSILGPLEFIKFMGDVTLVFERRNIKHHLFADDKQAYTSAPLHDVDDLHNCLHACITDINNCARHIGHCSTRK